MIKIDSETIKKEMDELKAKISSEYNFIEREYYRGMLSAWEWLTNNEGNGIVRNNIDMATEILHLEDILKNIVSKYGEKKRIYKVEDMKKYAIAEGMLDVINLVFRE